MSWYCGRPGALSGGAGRASSQKQLKGAKSGPSENRRPWLLTKVVFLESNVVRLVLRTEFFLVAALVLAGCGGNSLPSGSVVNSPGGGTGGPPPRLISIEVTVTVPRGKGNHQKHVRPRYVSDDTASLVVQLTSVNGQGVSGVNPTTIETQPHAGDCKAGSQGLVCSAKAWGSPGNDVFAVTTYDGPSATGAVLSIGSVSAKMGQNGNLQISNKLSLSLQSVIASLSIAVEPKTGKRGKPEHSAVTLIAYDAGGAQIVGPSDFTEPIQLAIQGDTGKAFTLHGGGKSGPSLLIGKPTSDITLDYNGDKQAQTIDVQAGVEGSNIDQSARFTLHGKQPPPPVGTIYALNLGSNNGLGATVTEYDGTASGNAAPKRTLQLSSKLYARSIAVDSAGDLFVGYFDNAEGFQSSNGSPDKGNLIAVYAPGASGNDAQIATIAADKASKTALFPIEITFDKNGNLVTYGATAVDGNGGNNAVLIYNTPASGPTAPADAWAFVAPTLSYAGPTGLALDTSGNFYVNGALHTSLGPSDGLFIAPAADYNNPQVSPSRTLPWDAKTKLASGQTTNITIASSGEIAIGNWLRVGSSNPSCQAMINVYAAGTTGGVTEVAPLRVLTLDTVFTANSQCVSISNPLTPFFPSITLYGTSFFVADDFNNAIDAFSSSGQGTVKPNLRILGSSTQLNAPIALVITSAQTITRTR